MQSKAVSSQKSARTFTEENKGTDFVIIPNNLTKIYGNCAVVNSINLKVPKSVVKIDDSLVIVGLKEFVSQKIKCFLEGERQRIRNSQSIINEPKLLTLEKPASSFDPMGNQAVLKIMKILGITSRLLLKSYLSVYFQYNYILNHLKKTFNRNKIRKKKENGD